MTKAELIAKLNTKFYKVPEPEVVKNDPALRMYRVYPTVKTTDSMYSQMVDFYVENEGEPTESAYWGSGEPQKASEIHFSNRVLDMIDAKIQDGTIKYGYLVSANDVNEKGLISVVTNANLRKEAIVYKNAQDEITFDVI